MFDGGILHVAKNVKMCKNIIVDFVRIVQGGAVLIGSTMPVC